MAFVNLSGNAGLANVKPLLSNPFIPVLVALGTNIELRGTAVSCADVVALRAKRLGVDADCQFPPVVFETSTLPNAQIGVPCSATLVASGGDGVYYWTLSGGSLPSSLIQTLQITVLPP